MYDFILTFFVPGIKLLVKSAGGTLLDFIYLFFLVSYLKKNQEVINKRCK